MNADPATSVPASRRDTTMPVVPAERRVVVVRASQVFLGIVVALVLVEVLFWWRDDGAFPHVNFYVPDAELGVRLEPGASLRFRLGANPAADISINSKGYRGEEWGPPRNNEILAVGDSQVFGLGVEDGETFSAELARLTGRPVINGGVPTYGPLEYTSVVRELIAARKPRTVIYVVNFVNDLFEAERPNKDRHTVWDGWAVRRETAPTGSTLIPFRRWLFSQSHAVYAMRRWLHRETDAVDRGFASEGTWRDIVSIGEKTATAHGSARQRVAVESQESVARLTEVRQQLAKTELEIETLLRESGHVDYANATELEAARGRPGDIVRDGAAEEARSVPVTASLIRAGVRYRNRLAEQLVSGELKYRGVDRRADLAHSMAEQSKLLEERAALHSRAVADARVPSALEPRIREVAQLCREHDIELVVVALPIDVQVSADEWAKYGADPIDMTPTLVLLDDLVATAEALGARALNAAHALAAADGAAFLDGDIHMTAAGHAALARAIQIKMTEPPPIRLPNLSLAEGRSRLPAPDMWRVTPEMVVRGSTKAGCETVLIGEWFRATCRRIGRGAVPTGAEVLEGGHGEASVLVTSDAVTLIAPILSGDTFKADFFWDDFRRRLSGTFERGADGPHLQFGSRDTPGKALAVSPEAARLCECHEQVVKERLCAGDGYRPTCEATCAAAYGDASRECMAAYADDCAALLECAQGEPLHWPPCPAGAVNSPTTGRCVTLCSDTVPCAVGTCTEWRGTQACL